MLSQRCYKLYKYFCNEITSWNEEEVKACMMDLFQYSLEEVKDVPIILQDILQTEHLRTLPKVPQRSKEWFDLRTNRLTASDLAQALGRGKFGNRKSLLEKKAFPDMFPFKTLPALKWGTMFEDMGMRCYQQNVNPSRLHEFGLIPHTEIECFGASPDGITDDGIMVEMKCPFMRKCDQNVPEQYYLQIQGQLATCKLHFCDYVECYFETYHTITEYEILCKNLCSKNHGIILQFIEGTDNFKYVYSPENLSVDECIEWANKSVDLVLKENTSYLFVEMTPWRLKDMFHKRVSFDEELWKSLIPSIYEFWKEVEDLRKKGYLPPIENTLKKKSNTLNLSDSPPEKKIKFKFVEDSDEES